ncbi:hypothetical protein GGC64_005942 [Mycobacterium sp. OAS707]|uniref:hypothetical protein n=1 Tax=Mycobacterium sp. OAS707 TaxID=2663822 RepID=UPI0017890F22|nr:hypothetical protein [Mycobacterium sp. OAS707]MBE1551855.1 hypothetical protein [Mycobacterium sp. OAS707]
MQNIIAFAALLVSLVTAAATWWMSRVKAKRAHVSAEFHWLREYAYITLPSGEESRVGYHLVLTNDGPHCATNVNVKVYPGGRASDWKELVLTDVTPDELPLSVLDSGGRYPIPWALGKDGMECRNMRRFEIELEWYDGHGKQTRRIPLRKGNFHS